MLKFSRLVLKNFEKSLVYIGLADKASNIKGPISFLKLLLITINYNELKTHK